MRSRSAGQTPVSLAANAQKRVGFAAPSSQKPPSAVAPPLAVSTSAKAAASAVRPPPPRKTVDKNGGSRGLQATGKPVGSGTTVVRKPPGKMMIVPYEIGVDLRDYGSMEDVERKLSNLRQVKALIARGHSIESVSVLAAPGSLGKPTVGTSGGGNSASVAEISAASNLIGMGENSDPRTEAALKFSRANTSSEAVSAGAMGLSVANQGSGAAVPTSQAPSTVEGIANLRQLPDMEADKREEEIFPTRSLFKAPLRG